MESSGDRGVHVVAGGRVGGDDGRVGRRRRFYAVDGDVAVDSSSDACRIAYVIVVVNSGRNFEPG